MKAFVILTFALTAGAALAGSYYDQPYSIITSERTPSADPHLRTVIVNRVDDENAEHGGSYAAYGYAVVAPGPHKVTVDLPPRKGFKLATQNTFNLETRPCVRYIVAAELRTVTTQEWTPIVRREERIGECEAKFKIAAGVK
jgi:hypothetical protein